MRACDFSCEVIQAGVVVLNTGLRNTTVKPLAVSAGAYHLILGAAETHIESAAVVGLCYRALLECCDIVQLGSPAAHQTIQLGAHIPSLLELFAEPLGIPSGHALVVPDPLVSAIKDGRGMITITQCLLKHSEAPDLLRAIGVSTDIWLRTAPLRDEGLQYGLPAIMQAINKYRGHHDILELVRARHTIVTATYPSLHVSLPSPLV